jgi:hypothetical protein
MNPPALSQVAQQIEAQFEERAPNSLQDFLRDETARRLDSKGLSPSHYDVYLVRRNQLAGDDVVGPKNLHAGKYPEDILYGAAGSPIVRFRFAVQALRVHAARIRSLNPAHVEYGHQVALLWSEIGRLKEFIGVSPVISEIVAELRTARYQFLGKDTPPAVIVALAAVLQLITEANRLETALVDRVVETLEREGIDSQAMDALRPFHG